jgi:hypothetical protein
MISGLLSNSLPLRRISYAVFFLLNEARVSQPGKAAPSFFLFLDVLSDVR